MWRNKFNRVNKSKINSINLFKKINKEEEEVRVNKI